MKLSSRDKRAMVILGIVVCTLSVGKTANSFSPLPPETNLNASETRLHKLEQVASELSSAKTSAEATSAVLAGREAGLIEAADDKLAQEKLLDVVAKLAQAQSPPIAIRGKELGRSLPFGAYGKVSVTVSTSCRIEQLINFMADLTKQPEAIATEELHIYGVHPESKQMQVRLTIEGLVPAKLIPKSKELNEF